MKRARLRRRFHGVLLQVSAQPISAVFWTLSLLAFLGAVRPRFSPARGRFVSLPPKRVRRGPLEFPF
jgi:hypothetical protein